MASQPVVGFAGMTHLGLVSLAAAAAKGFHVVGYDPDAGLAAGLAVGQLPVSEPGLDELLRGRRAHTRFTADLGTLGQCDLIYLALDVPTDDTGTSDLSLLEILLEAVLNNAKDDAVVVVLSQVPPGFTRARQRPGRLIYYQVETLVFGRAVERATQPERIILGCAEPDEDLAPALKSFLAAFTCPLLPMRFESAELTKISINCFLVASVTVTNTLAELCERIGADWGEIAPALRLDRRIGQHAYLAPGLGLAGGNLERDLATVLRFAAAEGTDAGTIAAFVANSQYRRHWALSVLRHVLLAHNPIAPLGILGLAYKENTHSIKNSASIELIGQVPGSPIRVFDPLVPAESALHPNVTACEVALDVADGVDALVVMTPWPEFRQLDLIAAAQRMKGDILVDPYRLFTADAVAAAGLRHYVLGVG